MDDLPTFRSPACHVPYPEQWSTGGILTLAPRKNLPLDARSRCCKIQCWRCSLSHLEAAQCGNLVRSYTSIHDLERGQVQQLTFRICTCWCSSRNAMPEDVDLLTAMDRSADISQALELLPHTVLARDLSHLSVFELLTSSKAHLKVLNSADLLKQSSNLLVTRIATRRNG
jgi:hypothetical protein